MCCKFLDQIEVFRRELRKQFCSFVAKTSNTVSFFPKCFDCTVFTLLYLSHFHIFFLYFISKIISIPVQF